jgi:hypothetical protein
MSVELDNAKLTNINNILLLGCDIYLARETFRALVNEDELTPELEKAYTDLAGSCVDFLTAYKFYTDNHNRKKA